MKYLLALVLLLAVASAGALDWETTAHVAISGSAPFASYFMLRDVCKVSKPVSVGVAIGLPFALGAAKEIYDHSKSGKWQPGDWACNVIPLAIATGLIIWKGK